MDGPSVTFFRKRWQLVFEKMPKDDGRCDSPDTPNKKIRINPNVKRNDIHYLDVVLHELLHAAHWNLSEEAVEEYATNAAQLLYKLGFRLVEDPYGKTKATE